VTENATSTIRSFRRLQHFSQPLSSSGVYKGRKGRERTNDHQEALGRLFTFYCERVVNRLAACAAAGVGTLVVLAGAAGGGYVLGQSAPRTQPSAATRTMTGSGLRVPCSETSSGVSSPLFLVVGNLQAAGLNGLYEGMCSVTISPFNRVGNGVVTLTDASGLSTTYNLGIPAGH
jgi:hypothetical protein